MSDPFYDLLANEDDRKQRLKTGRQRIAARLLAIVSMVSLRRRRGGNHVLEDGRVATATSEGKQWSRAPSCSCVVQVSLLVILILYVMRHTQMHHRYNISLIFDPVQCSILSGTCFAPTCYDSLHQETHQNGRFRARSLRASAPSTAIRTTIISSSVLSLTP